MTSVVHCLKAINVKLIMSTNRLVVDIGIIKWHVYSNQEMSTNILIAL